MSRSRKDGRRGGGHRGWHTLRDLWGKRGGARMGGLSSDRYGKTLCSRIERRIAKREIFRQRRDTE